jgi:NADH dehydrogenase
MIGPADALLTALAGLARWPVVPLLGDGGTRLAPASVTDVAQAAAVALTGRDTHPGISEFAGPDTVSYRDLVGRVAALLDRRPRLILVPFLVWDALAAAGRLLPVPPVTEGQVALMRRDNLPAPGLPGLAAFGIDPPPSKPSSARRSRSRDRQAKGIA